ncbi:MAG: ABC transporter permease [Burkholderiaceae bacterium]
MISLLRTFSWQEVLHHPWRSVAAVVAIVLGVALAFAVHLINASALAEFSSAVRAVNGQPDIELRSASGPLDESLYARVAQHPAVDIASPVLEVSTYELDAAGNKQPIKLLGIDALVAARVSPSLLPEPDAKQHAGDARFHLFAADSIYLNASASQFLRHYPKDPLTPFKVNLLTGLRTTQLTAMGTIAAGGGALAVLDIAALQELFGLQGVITRIDLRLAPGADRSALLRGLTLPAHVLVQAPGDAEERVSNLSRAYRVNMTVLALVALFTGAFLVYSVLSLSVAKRAQQMALLGVLGLTAAQRLRLVVAEAVVLGLVGSMLGLALGAGLAALALRLLGGDLGGGYFSGVAPPLQWSLPTALAYGLLGVAAAVVGAWWPARAAQSLPLAQTLKGLGAGSSIGVQTRQRWIALIFIAASALLMWTPPLFDIPLGAYLAIGLLLVGGIGLLPAAVALVYDRLAPLVANRALPLLAVERARRVRETAAVAVSGVVAALSLAVALTVMVSSFRTSVTQWLDAVLPAPLYVRSAGTLAAAQVLHFSPELLAQVQGLPGIARAAGQRTLALQLDSTQPSVMLTARLIDDAAKDLPLIHGPVPPAAHLPAGAIALYVSEAVVDLHAARLGQKFMLNLPVVLVNRTQAAINNEATPSYYVAGVWRDYARQFGAIAIDRRAYVRITGDHKVNDIAIWPAQGTSPQAVQASVRALINRALAANATGGGGEDVGAGTTALEASKLVEFASADEIRALSLKIFDRSFAVTYWLQAVAIAIGLFGVAASFSAQVLARRKEFGLLTHLGLTRRQILQVVAGEGAAWTAIGSLAGCALGLCVAAILVHVVNPQSFHWTMDLAVPWLRIALLCLAVVAAGTLTAWLAGRAAAGKDAVLAVKEDW